MRRRVSWLIALWLWLALLIPSLSFAAEPVVDVYMFYAETCPHCHVVIDEILPGIREKYGDRINLQLFEVYDPVAFKVGLVMEKLYGVPEEQSGVPEIFVGRTVLIGENSIREHLDKEIQSYLDAGGFRLPTPGQLLALIVEETPQASPTLTPSPAATSPPPRETATLAPTPTGGGDETPGPTPVARVSPTANTEVEDDRVIHMAYFYEVGCSECDRASIVLNYLQSEYPDLVIESFDVIKQAGLADWLGERYGLPPEERLETPVVFLGDEYLLDKAITVEALTALLDKYSQTGTEPVWAAYDEREAQGAVAGLFENISLLAVVSAGLVDGLNPCAFATIVFFIAYLAFVGRKGREVLFTGIAFTLGVFVAYLLLGVGLLRVLEFANLTRFGRYVYIAAAALCFVLGVVNLLDFFKARQGRPEEMRMRLPISMRRWVNRVIRESSGANAYALVAFVTGLVVSLIELACTGQVYIVILSALSHPTLRNEAFGYLLLYNLAFVLPLIAVFLFAFFGVSSQELALFLERRTAVVKLFTALLFLGVGAWLVYAFLPLFGLRLV